MTDDFVREVQSIVGPLLAELGFALDEIDDDPDEGGRPQHVVYFRSADCKVQVYDSAREGDVNCMIAPLEAPNAFGPRTKGWLPLTRFTKMPDLPLDQLIKLARAEYEAYANPLHWVRDRIEKYYSAAHVGVLQMRRGGA